MDVSRDLAARDASHDHEHAPAAGTNPILEATTGVNLEKGPDTANRYSGASASAASSAPFNIKTEGMSSNLDGTSDPDPMTDIKPRMDSISGPNFNIDLNADMEATLLGLQWDHRANNRLKSGTASTFDASLNSNAEASADVTDAKESHDMGNIPAHLDVSDPAVKAHMNARIDLSLADSKRRLELFSVEAQCDAGIPPTLEAMHFFGTIHPPVGQPPANMRAAEVQREWRILDLQLKKACRTAAVTELRKVPNHVQAVEEHRTQQRAMVEREDELMRTYLGESTPTAGPSGGTGGL